MDEVQSQTSVKHALNDSLSVSSNIIMAIGFGWAALGFYLMEFWWIFGGFMLFYMGVMTLPVNIEGGGCQGEGMGPKTP
jgi:hypothetical protein